VASALGTVLGATAYSAVPPAPNLCWYWANPAQTQGYWDYCWNDAPVAQRIEHQTSNLGVGGSSPSGRASKIKELKEIPLFGLKAK
jgi:hypothetical protein